jgi:hypothetical protein
MLMQKLRKNIKYVFFIALAGFLGLIFFQWGANVTGIRSEQKTDIAKINGTPVSFRDYIAFVRSKETEYRDISSDRIWNMLIDEVMWNKLLKEEKLRVTDEEILAIIKSNPPREIYEADIMKNEQGEFDFDKYYELLRAPQSRSWLLEYEYQLRREVPREKLRSLMSTFGWTSPFEDSMMLAGLMTRYDIAYLQLPLFRARRMLDITDEEAAAYFADHRAEFKNSVQRILKYVYFERKASTYDTLEARERIEDFLALIEEGEDFLELATEVSDDTSIVITFEGKAGLKPYLMTVYENLKNGEVSDIIQASHGFEVIKRISRGKIYKVKTNIEISQTTIGEIYDLIMSFKETAKEIGFDSSAVEFDLPIRQTYPLALDNISFPVRNSEMFADLVANIKHNEISGPFASIGGYYLFQLDSIIPPYQPEFEEIMARVKANMEKELVQGILQQYLDRTYDKLTGGNTMESMADKDTMLYFRSQADVDMTQIRMALGGEFAGVAIKLDAGQISRPLITEWAGYIIRCDKRVQIDFDSSMIAPLQMKKQSRLQEVSIDLFIPEEIEDYRDEFFVD